MITSKFFTTNLPPTVEGFVLVNDLSKQQIEEQIEDYVKSNNGEEVWYTEKDCIDKVTNDGFNIVPLTEVEYNRLEELFGPSYGQYVGPDFD